MEILEYFRVGMLGLKHTENSLISVSYESRAFAYSNYPEPFH